MFKLGDRNLDGDCILILVENVVFGKGLHSCEDDRIKGDSHIIAFLRTIAPPKKADRTSKKTIAFPQKPIAPPTKNDRIFPSNRTNDRKPIAFPLMDGRSHFR